jgi:hypothetical protein
VQRGLQLLREQDLVVHGPLVQQADRGDVGEALHDGEMVVGEGQSLDREQVEGADDLVAEAHRHGVGHAEADVAGGVGEDRPPVLGRAQIDVRYGLTGGEAVQAGAFVPLQFEQLQQVRRLVGVGDHLQGAALVVEHQAGGVGVDQFDAALGQDLQEVEDVELLDQRVGQLDEHLCQALLPHH